MSKKIILSIFIFILSIVVLFLSVEYKKDYLYDQKTKQKPVYTYQEIDKVLSAFPIITYQQLDAKYRKATGLENPQYYYATFYVIQGEDIFKYLVGKFRVLDFLPKDKYYNQNIQNLKANHKIYLLLDKRVLYKFLELMLALEKKGYDKNAFVVNDGFRYPTYNKNVGGATGSLHTYGMAIDVDILDINKNGIADKEDKQIVLDLLENHIIAQMGGVGRYPWSQTVHFDVRGWYARWDKQH